MKYFNSFSFKAGRNINFAWKNIWCIWSSNIPRQSFFFLPVRSFLYSSCFPGQFDLAICSLSNFLSCLHLNCQHQFSTHQQKCTWKLKTSGKDKTNHPPFLIACQWCYATFCLIFQRFLNLTSSEPRVFWNLPLPKALILFFLHLPINWIWIYPAVVLEH